MASKKRQTMHYRRKREGRTDYKKRLNLLVAGKTRLVVRKSSANMLVQLVQYEVNGDKILVTARATDLKKLGWKFACGNIPAAYLTGYIVGKKGAAKSIKDVILDIGLQAKGRRLFAVLKGAIDAGLNIPHDDKVLPDDNEVKGSKIAAYADLLKDSKLKAQFSQNNIKDITKAFDAVKEKIK